MRPVKCDENFASLLLFGQTIRPPLLGSKNSDIHMYPAIGVFNNAIFS